MREIEPYRTESGLMKAIDNGGHLYNIMSRRGDNIITYGELAKAAGAISTGIYAFLFFEMSQQDLPEDARERAVQSLEPLLRKEFIKDRPVSILPSEIDTRVATGRGVIIEGYPCPLEDSAVHEARVNYAISTGSGTGYEKVPLVEYYDILEVYNSEGMEGPKAVVAVDRGFQYESGERIRLGGILRKLLYKEKSPENPKKFLEAIFYTRC